MRWKLLAASLLFAAGCSAAHADRIEPVGPRTALAIAPAKIRAPYDVQILRESGETAPTYALKDRFYVQGSAGERYIVRVSNPTARRIEAVVTVDGLDVVDGEPGDLRKRGYVVPPYGEVRIEGFRTSQDDVATFRFSSVANSYAGKKGKARNVGVIAVALFEEQAQPEQQQIIVQPPGDGFRPPYDYDDDIDVDVNVNINRRRDIVGKAEAKGSGSKRMAPSATAPAAPPPAPTGGAARPTRSLDESAAADPGITNGGEAAPVVQRRYEQQQRERLGLGTEFGEQRYSAASFTKFVRAPGRPVAIAELRYNDAAGLMALGINVGPMPDEGEIMTRETADPFPGDQRFAAPPSFQR
ncbi:MAG TPA: hypothetical protein VM513_07070 [Kofleriaceae bacterium]|jgi:hypothetical protein|nr:hypothetical protein [Kofleriaceae bacterium]